MKKKEKKIEREEEEKEDGYIDRGIGGCVCD